MARIRLYLILIFFMNINPLLAEDLTQLGGQMTSTFLSPAAIQVYGPNVESKESQFQQVNGFSPFHTRLKAENGLGPGFVNASCGGCHVENGRGPISFDHSPLLSGGAIVVKVKNLKKSAGITVGPVLQNHNVDGKSAYELRMRWEKIKGTYPDGTKYSLRKPLISFSIDNLSQRSFAYSLRMSPPIIGVGLIEAIDSSEILKNYDPLDADNDGISGRANIVDDIRNGKKELGRFGFKAGQPTVEQQSAAALGNEMGLSNSLFPVSDVIEFSDQELASVTIYQKLAGVPAARDQTDPQVEIGKKLFFEAGCENCHRSTFVTGNNNLPELAGQTIHPFSDFLLHDMGPGLADKHSEELARGSEWKTTPLWGLGFSKYLSDVTPRYLHDGRARTLEEAIIWHGGESEKSRNNFMSMDRQNRLALFSFLRSL